jgi:hypothetical protein
MRVLEPERPGVCHPLSNQRSEVTCRIHDFRSIPEVCEQSSTRGADPIRWEQVLYFLPVNPHIARVLALTLAVTFSNATLKAVDWEGLIPAIEPVLQKAFSGGDVHVGEPRPIGIYAKADLTGDGIEEALVSLGTGGAYTDFLTLMRMDNGKPVLARYKSKDGKPCCELIMTGASVRHGFGVKLLPEQHAIYFGSTTTDDSGKMDSCSVAAYQWNPHTKTFDLNRRLSKTVEKDYCRSLASGK